MRGRLGLWSGIGLVVADMAGVGVLTTSGFMATNLGPKEILLGWVVGGILAVSGAVAYAAIARTIAKSGGEYRYLSELLHPAVGYVAGWTSFLVGFSAPVAMAAYTAGAFAEAVNPMFQTRTVGALLISLAAIAHAVHSKWSALSQDLLAALKAVLLIGFVVVGVFKGQTAAPTWTPVDASSAFPSFMVSLVYIAFSYSGWNATIYAAEEFKEPERDVPRSMIIGCLLVMALYLAVNTVFLANLSQARIVSWSQGDTSRVTLAHLIVEDWLGPLGGDIMSAIVVLVLASSISVMSMTGPRVYAAMARDGYLPKLFSGDPRRPPRAAIIAQAVFSLALLYTQSFEWLMRTVGAVLTASAALTAIAVFRVRFDSRFAAKPSPLALIAAGLYVVASLGILSFTLSRSSTGILWALGAALVMLGGYRIAKQSA